MRNLLRLSKFSKAALASTAVVFAVQANAEQCSDFGATAFACMIEKTVKLSLST